MTIEELIAYLQSLWGDSKIVILHDDDQVQALALDDLRYDQDDHTLKIDGRFE